MCTQSVTLSQTSGCVLALRTYAAHAVGHAQVCMIVRMIAVVSNMEFSYRHEYGKRKREQGRRAEPHMPTQMHGACTHYAYSFHAKALLTSLEGKYY